MSWSCAGVVPRQRTLYRLPGVRIRIKGACDLEFRRTYRANNDRIVISKTPSEVPVSLQEVLLAAPRRGEEAQGGQWQEPLSPCDVADQSLWLDEQIVHGSSLLHSPRPHRVACGGYAGRQAASGGSLPTTGEALDKHDNEERGQPAHAAVPQHVGRVHRLTSFSPSGLAQRQPTAAANHR